MSTSNTNQPPQPLQPPPMTFGLEEIGIPGSSFLKEALTNCSDPLKQIEEFQV